MKLLFIYFYETKATFEKGTIIRFSKKYNIDKLEELNQKSHFNIYLSKNETYQDDFYSSNTDMGIIIGENGTGKSILLNSIRDNNNNYSIIIYEYKNKFFFINHVHKTITIKVDEKIENVQKSDNNFEYIYYSSIIDTSDNDIESKYNISNRNLLTKYDNVPFKNRLSLIENDDIHNYFNMTKNINLDYAKIKKLKIYSSKTYFKEVKEQIINNYDLDVFETLINIFDNNVAKYGKNIKELIKILPNNEQREILYSILQNDEYIFYILFNSKSLLDKQYKYIENFLINKVFRFKDKKYKLLEQELNLYLQNNNRENKLLQDLIYRLLKYIKIDHLSYALTRNHIEERDLYEISYRLTKELYYYFEKNIDSTIIENYLYGFFRNTSFKYEELIHDIKYNDDLRELLIYTIIKNLQYELIQKISDEINYRKDLNVNINIIERLVNISIINFYIKRFERLTPLENLDKRNYPDIVYQSIKLKILTINQITHNIKHYKDFVENFIDEFINDIIIRSNNLKLVKLSFILSFYSYFLLLKDEADINRLQSFLNVIFNLSEDISQYKNFTIQKNEPIVDLLKRLDIHFGIFKLGEKLNVLKEPMKYENGNLITEVTETFFETYKIIIKNSIKPFTYEVYPPLSSGQKAILFIFARIDNAIKEINKKNNNRDILILLDEADLKLHLEWQRTFINGLVEFFNSYYNNKFYILYATHSPMILSDITNDRVTFLKNNENYTLDISDDRKTFGANIYDIYNDSFFMDSFMGSFAEKKINQVIDIINLYKMTKQTSHKVIEKKDLINSFNSFFNTNVKETNIIDDVNRLLQNKEFINKIKLTIQSIGEPMLKNKMLNDIKYLFDEQKTIDDVLIILKDKNNKDRLDIINKYTPEEQSQILKKLYLKNHDD